jgi:hypothetical protein
VRSWHEAAYPDVRFHGGSWEAKRTLTSQKATFVTEAAIKASVVRLSNFRARARMSGDRLRVIIYLRAVALALAT